jgi:hypothetical protein
VEYDEDREIKDPEEEKPKPAPGVRPGDRQGCRG